MIIIAAPAKVTAVVTDTNAQFAETFPPHFKFMAQHVIIVDLDLAFVALAAAVFPSFACSSEYSTIDM